MKKLFFSLLLVTLIATLAVTNAPRPILAGNPNPNYLLSGIVNGPRGPIAGVTVSAGVGNPSTQTDSSGYYQLDLPAGIYTITTPITSTCYTPGLAIVTVPPAQTVNFQLAARLIGGYRCDDLAHPPYIAATTPITNFTDLDDGTAPLILPFDFTYFGTTYPAGSTINVSTNGNLQFSGTDPSAWHQHIPNPAPPNNAIYAFAADLTLAENRRSPDRPLGRGVYAVETSAMQPNRSSFVVEWRDVGVVGGGTANFEIVLEQGSNDIYVNYGAISILDTLLYSVEGIENGDGSVAFEYNYLQGLLNNLLSNTSVLFYTDLLPPPTATPCAMPFTDLGGSPFHAAIQYLYCAGVVSGSDATHYAPAGTASRAQFAKVVVLGFGIQSYTPSQPTFTDVPSSYFAYPYIESGYHAAILSGFDATGCGQAGATYPCYLPSRSITRAQLAKLVVSAAGYASYTPSTPSFVDVGPNNIFYPAIETAHYHGIINGYSDNTFRPANLVRRDEMAQIVYRGITTP